MMVPRQLSIHTMMLAASCAVAFPATAQDDVLVHGVVVVKGRNVVPWVDIAIEDVEGEITANATSGPDGYFELGRVPRRVYRLTASFDHVVLYESEVELETDFALLMVELGVYAEPLQCPDRPRHA